MNGATTNVTGFGVTGNPERTATTAGNTGIFSLPVQTGLNANAWNPNNRSFVASVEQPAVSHALLSGLTTTDFRGAFGNSSEVNNANWFISAPWVAFN